MKHLWHKYFTKKQPIVASDDSELITTCQDLSINGFLACTYGGNLSALVKKGTPDQSKLYEAWAAIFEEYAILTGNTKYKELKSIMIEYLRMSGHLMLIKSSLAILAYRYDRDTANNIKKMGYSVKLDPSDKQEYEADLNKLLGNASGLELKCNIQLAEIERIKKEAEKETKSTEQDFRKGLVVISKFMQFRIDPKQVSIAEYAAFQNQYSDYVNQQKREAKK
jgi:predicted HicB family RNase H-like nuclease